MIPLAEQEARSTPAMSGAASVYLDALRAIAANVVVVSHVMLVYLGGGSMGGAGFAVALFFLLSGFLITQSMLSWRNRPQPRLAGFLADRVARIFTPYVPALLLVVAANAFFITSKWGAPGVNTGALSFLGNLLMLQDHSVFQLLAILHVDVPWRIRPYNAAEPFWTVSIEMWIYVAAGLFFFCVLGRERIRRRTLWPLVALSFPVVVWNAAAGGGKSLTLIWLFGAVAACAITSVWAAGSRRTGWLAFWLVAFGAAGLSGRIAKVGFDAYELQTAALVAMIAFGVLVGLARVQSVPPLLERACRLLASYSYSLYLIHNTVLIVAFEATQGMSRWVSIPLGVLLSHGVAIALYLAFERHHRRVAQWLRPRFARAIDPSVAPVVPLASTEPAAAAPARLFGSTPH